MFRKELCAFEPQPVKNTGAKIFHHDIGGQCQAAHEVDTCRKLHVDDDALFVAVDGQVVDTVISHEMRGNGSREIASGRLHLDDPSAKIAEHLSAVGT